jgi:hypothetical protein
MRAEDGRMMAEQATMKAGHEKMMTARKKS